MANDKYLFVVSGAAGTGKDSVVKALREAHPEIEKTVSATTRAPRPGEQEGVDYYYRTREQFQQLIENDQVVEHNFYNGNYYGTLRPPCSCCRRRWRSWSAVCGAAAPRPRTAFRNVLPPPRRSWPSRINSP